MNEIKTKKMLNMFAYVAVIFLGLSLVVESVFGGNIFAEIASIISYIIVSIFAFYYAKTKRNIGYMVAYIVSIVLIIIMLVIPFITN
ncbi:MAG: hypothetical protein ACOCRX_10780 [Candidatus Woesearchaeota archaeon]